MIPYFKNKEGRVCLRVYFMHHVLNGYSYLKNNLIWFIIVL